MNRIAPNFPSATPRAAGEEYRLFHAVASGLALACWLLVAITLIGRWQLPGKPGWPEAVLVLAATLATLFSLVRQLPAQNVVLAALIIAIIGGGIHALGAATAIPFGPFVYLDAVGPRIFNTVAWPIPFLWIIVILNSRGVARLILRPWRKLRSYGFWLIGITAALTVLFDVALEPFATAVKHYWLWHPTRLPLTWGGAPVTNFVGWLVTALFILIFATPALIDKRRQRSTSHPPDYHPLIVWLLAVVLFGLGAVTKQLWLQTGVSGCVGLAVAFFAVRGAKW